MALLTRSLTILAVIVSFKWTSIGFDFASVHTVKRIDCDQVFTFN